MDLFNKLCLKKKVWKVLSIILLLNSNYFVLKLVSNFIVKILKEIMILFKVMFRNIGIFFELLYIVIGLLCVMLLSVIFI